MKLLRERLLHLRLRSFRDLMRVRSDGEVRSEAVPAMQASPAPSARTDLRPALTTAEGWEAYARAAIERGNHRLGDEWNVATEVGLADDVVDVLGHIDEKIVTPFLEGCKVVLELGAGGGRWTERLLPRCARLIACDTSPAMLELVERRLGGCPPALETALLDGRGLGSIAGASIDAVFSYDVFVHLPHWDIYNYLCEIHRVLKPGGRALIHHAHVFSDLGWMNFLDEISYTVNRHKPYGNFTVMTPAIMREFIVRAGLACEAIRTDVVPRDAIALIHKNSSETQA